MSESWLNDLYSKSYSRARSFACLGTPPTRFQHLVLLVALACDRLQVARQWTVIGIPYPSTSRKGKVRSSLTYLHVTLDELRYPYLDHILRHCTRLCLMNLFMPYLMWYSARTSPAVRRLPSLCIPRFREIFTSPHFERTKISTGWDHVLQCYWSNYFQPEPRIEGNQETESL
jgi:hypothetical protein